VVLEGSLSPEWVGVGRFVVAGGKTRERYW
jgi:hypothetical protein